MNNTLRKWYLTTTRKFSGLHRPCVSSTRASAQTKSDLIDGQKMNHSHDLYHHRFRFDRCACFRARVFWFRVAILVFWACQQELTTTKRHQKQEAGRDRAPSFAGYSVSFSLELGYRLLKSITCCGVHLPFVVNWQIRNRHTRAFCTDTSLKRYIVTCGSICPAYCVRDSLRLVGSLPLPLNPERKSEEP